MDVKSRVNSFVWELGEYVPGEFRQGFVKLASNENNWGPSPKVVERLRQIADRTFLYPYQEGEVRQRIADYIGVKRSNVILGNGSDEIMDLLIKAFGGPVAASYPSFANYPLAAGILGQEYIPISLEGDFSFDVDRFIEGSRDAKICFLCSPNNPTGLSIEREDVKKVAGTGKITVVDEAYFEFCEKTSVDLISEFPNVIVLRTLSKAFALAGLRIGYGVADDVMISALNRVKPPFNTSLFAEAAALAALDDIPYMKEVVGRINKSKREITDVLSKKFRVFPSDGNFIFFDCSPLSSKEFFDAMIERKIIVRVFGKLKGFEGDYIRMSPGTDEENELFIRAVEEL